MWQSTDPAVAKYLPVMPMDQEALDEYKKGPYEYWKKNLPGMGGAYNDLNLALYTYGHQNPVKMVDPDGNETLIFTVRDTFGYGKFSFSMGTHSAVWVSGGNGVLYDPAGSFRAVDHGVKYHPTGETFPGGYSLVSSYIKHHTDIGSTVEVKRFNTTPEQEAAIIQNMDEQGGAPPFFCAHHTSSVIQGIGPFKNLWVKFLPGSLSFWLPKPDKTEVFTHEDFK